MTLDDDVADLLDTAMHREKKPMKQIVNEALRRGLSPESGKPRKRYRVRPHRTSLRPGIDPSAFNRLLDEVEDEAVVEKIARAR